MSLPCRHGGNKHAQKKKYFDTVRPKGLHFEEEKANEITDWSHRTDKMTRAPVHRKAYKMTIYLV